MRGNSLDASRRVYLSIARGTINAADDSHMMQTNDVRVLQNELLTGVERFQPYGVSSVPMAPANDSSGKAAEAIIGFVNGSRSHPIVLAVDDRRYRPKNLKAGDSAMYHHSNAIMKFTDDGFVHDQGSAKKPYTLTVGNATLTVADGKITADVNGTNVVVSDGKVETTVKGTLLVVTDGKISFGSESASIPVMLQTGASTLLFSTK
ncbi:phage baseplate assembly protein V [Beijerinckia sp. L45]|uniref:phage baseplate assembly protein V n=1 Tax=Beijerinckia sp. L45 TaxID=1641855 RepID=UPI00131E13EC|nr:phage baseplate assembly protein V [Beijerinckia sp. L45]